MTGDDRQLQRMTSERDVAYRMLTDALSGVNHDDLCDRHVTSRLGPTQEVVLLAAARRHPAPLRLYHLAEKSRVVRQSTFDALIIRGLMRRDRRVGPNAYRLTDVGVYVAAELRCREADRALRLRRERQAQRQLKRSPRRPARLIACHHESADVRADR